MAVVLDPKTKRVLDKLCQSPSGAYLLWGPLATGKFFTLRHQAQKAISHPANLIIVDEGGGSIGIDEIQHLAQQLSLKTVNQSSRWVIIRDAERMTREAQNAFLKTLEEPLGPTVIWLTVSDRSRLLPTVLSRLKVIDLAPLEQSVIQSYLADNLNLNQKLAMEIADLCQGAIGLAHQLAHDQAAYQTIKQVKSLSNDLTDTKISLYQRLQVAQTLQSESALDLLIKLRELAQHQLRFALDQGSAAIKRAQRRLQLTQQLIRYLEANGNAKIALNQLVLSTL